ncbi:MAG: 50S ribosomal protein L21 [Bacillota bacterium]
MYAVVETGGKQYKVTIGNVIWVEKIEAEIGASVDLENVLTVVKDDGQVLIGTPRVFGAKVKATIVNHGRGPKILVFKYKSKTNYRKRQGHRQPFTSLKIEAIEA